jgi:UDP-N-acetylglucosamine 2-epimerase (non-hydrolysing)
VPEARTYFVGNVMIDTLLQHRERSERSAILDELALKDGGYTVLTLHRPASVDCPQTLGQLLSALARLSRELPIVFPVHPRTRRALQEGLPQGSQGQALLRGSPTFKLVEPLGYLDFLKLMAHARLVLTDSGGVQEETTVLGVPCLTLRTSTERPATLTEGTNTLVGLDPERIVAAGLKALAQPRGQARRPELWDGRAAARIVDVLSQTATQGGDLS